jgi:hypothetical protein
MRHRGNAGDRHKVAHQVDGIFNTSTLNHVSVGLGRLGQANDPEAPGLLSPSPSGQEFRHLFDRWRAPGCRCAQPVGMTPRSDAAFRGRLPELFRQRGQNQGRCDDWPEQPAASGDGDRQGEVTAKLKVGSKIKVQQVASASYAPISQTHDER